MLSVSRIVAGRLHQDVRAWPSAKEIGCDTGPPPEAYIALDPYRLPRCRATKNPWGEGRTSVASVPDLREFSWQLQVWWRREHVQALDCRAMNNAQASVGIEGALTSAMCHSPVVDHNEIARDVGMVEAGLLTEFMKSAEERLHLYRCERRAHTIVADMHHSTCHGQMQESSIPVRDRVRVQERVNDAAVGVDRRHAPQQFSFVVTEEIVDNAQMSERRACVTVFRDSHNVIPCVREDVGRKAAVIVPLCAWA